MNSAVRVCAVLISTLILVSCQSKVSLGIATFKAKRGEFLAGVTETGELKAVNSVMINAPSIDWRFGALKITQLVEDGAQVGVGDVLVEFDKAEVEKAIVDAKAELEIAKADLRKTLAQQASQIEDLEAGFQQTKLQHRISQLNLEKSSYESDIRKKEIELELEKAAISLDKAEKEIENQKSINKEELSKLELRVNQVESKLSEAYSTLAKLTVKSPAQGIAIIERNWSTDQKIAVEDQLWPGWPMISLPDLSQMKAETPVNEIDISKIDTTLDAYIRLDAFPDTSFHGRVTDVATLARNKDRDSRVKVFDVTIVLDENDARLMPGMTVSCEIIVDRIKNIISIPMEAVFEKEGKKLVYVKKGGAFEPRQVTVGQDNSDFIIINKGLEENEQVALVDPTQGSESAGEGGQGS